MGLKLRFELYALGRPYHAARVRFGPRAGDSVPHGHADFHELMAVVAGRGEHLLEQGRVPLEVGDVVLVRPRDTHAMTGRSPDGIEFVNVAFPSSLWHGFCDLTGADPARQWERERQPPVFRAEPGRRRAVDAAFESLLDSFQCGPGSFDLPRFWAEVFASVTPREHQASSGTPRWLADACRGMLREENLRQGVPRLVRLARVSPAHLARSMRQYYGVTPTSFVADLRLKHAAELLARTHESVATIAARCGFSSQSYFTRCFQTAHQMPPREFRFRTLRAFVP